MPLVTRRVLIIKTSSLGDIMHGLQVAQTIKENDPGIEITWLARGRYEPLVRSCEAVDKTLIFRRYGGMAEIVRLCRRLRQEPFDYVLDFQGLARSGLMTFFSRSKRKIGRSDAREGASLFYRELVPMPPNVPRHHPVDILLEFCRVFGFETKLRGAVRFALSQNDSANQTAVSENRKRVTLFPEGRFKRAQWEGFNALAKLMLEKLESVEITLLSTRPLSWASTLKNEFSGRVEIVATDNLLRIAGCIQESDLLVANECDATHIAAAVRVGTATLFGPTDPVRHGAYPIGDPIHQVIVAPGKELSLLQAEAVFDEIAKRF